MRDPNRIPDVLAAVRRVWDAHPDLRLGQLLSNCVVVKTDALYSMEDDELLARLWAVYDDVPPDPGKKP